MKKIPICLVIDDSAPVVSISYHANRFLADGREKIEHFPNALLYKFCDLTEQYGVKGKFSIVPMPAGQGDIMNGIKGVPAHEVAEWLDTVRLRLAPSFSICPEMLTHGNAYDISAEKMTDIREDEWSCLQNRESLTRYITKALTLVRDAGFTTRGVTSPWEFGKSVEDAYIRAISDALFDVTGSVNGWYFLHCIRNTANVRPWLALSDGDRRLVSIPVTTRDHVWKTLESERSDSEFISEIADGYITEDGGDGEIVRVLNSGGYPVMLTHWQSLMSNGTGVGIEALRLVLDRIEKHLSDRVIWMSFDEIMSMVLSEESADN